MKTFRKAWKGVSFQEVSSQDFVSPSAILKGRCGGCAGCAGCCFSGWVGCR